MFASKCIESDKCDRLDSKFRTAFEFLRNTDLKALTPGSQIKLAEGVTAIIKEPYLTQPREDRKFEIHRRHFDIQYVVEGREFIGTVFAQGLIPDGGYDEKEDILFFKEPEQSGGLVLREGDVAVFSPEDAHKPNCAVDRPEMVRKIVIKVAVRGEKMIQ